MKPVEVGLLAPLPLLEHLVELGQHVLHPGMASGSALLMAPAIWLKYDWASCWRSWSISSSNCSRASDEVNSYSESSLHLAGQVGRQQVELHALLGGDLLGDLPAALVAGGPGLALEVVDPLALGVDDVAQRLGDLVVDAAEVVALELLPPLAAQLLEQLPHALDPLAVAVPEARLQHPAQGGVQVAVVEQVVGDLGQDGVGVEVEADLGAVPAGVVGAGHGPRLRPERVDLP